MVSPNLALSALLLSVGGARPPVQGPDRLTPRVLIVQAHVPNNRDGDPNVAVAIALSTELDNTGRVTSVVWSMTDPVFRDAVGNRKIILSDAPTNADIMGGARAIGAEYVLVFSAYRAGPNVKSEAHLYRAGREEWHDRESMAVALGGAYNAEESGRSVARTIAAKMQQSALRSLPAIPKTRTPEPAPGQAPVHFTAESAVAAPPVNDDDTLQRSVDAVVKVGNFAAAVAAVRDAIDAAPFDARRRSMLISLLAEREPDHAAEEARRAAIILPDHGEFRLLAARAWLQSGHPKEAQEELNEAVAHAPNAPETRLMLAEIAIQNLDPERALPHLEAAIKTDPSAEAYFLRALCRAMLGGVDGMKMDLAAMVKAEPTPSPADALRRHRLAVEVFDQQLARDTEQFRELIQRVSIKPKDPTTREQLASAQRRLAARIAFMEMTPVPAAAQRAHDRWLLVDKLYAQSLLDVQTFIGGSDDALTDARMNLGEGIKQAQLARSEPK